MDSENPQYKDAIEQWWLQVNIEKHGENRIFHEFINKERNSTIKEYIINYIHNDGFDLGIIDESGIITTFHEMGFGGSMYVPIAKGAYSVEDCRDIIRKSIDWWSEQLQKIKSNASFSKTI